MEQNQSPFLGWDVLLSKQCQKKWRLLRKSVWFFIIQNLGKAIFTLEHYLLTHTHSTGQWFLIFQLNELILVWTPAWILPICLVAFHQHHLKCIVKCLPPTVIKRDSATSPWHMAREEILPQKTQLDLFSDVGQLSIDQTFCLTLEYGAGGGSFFCLEWLCKWVNLWE